MKKKLGLWFISAPGCNATAFSQGVQRAGFSVNETKRGVKECTTRSWYPNHLTCIPTASRWPLATAIYHMHPNPWRKRSNHAHCRGRSPLTLSAPPSGIRHTVVVSTCAGRHALEAEELGARRLRRGRDAGAADPRRGVRAAGLRGGAGRRGRRAGARGGGRARPGAALRAGAAGGGAAGVRVRPEGRAPDPLRCRRVPPCRHRRRPPVQAVGDRPPGACWCWVYGSCTYMCTGARIGFII